MKIVFPNGLVKDIEPTTCSPVELNGNVKFCLMFDPILTFDEVEKLKIFSESKLAKLQNPDDTTPEQNELQLLITGSESVLNP